VITNCKALTEEPLPDWVPFNDADVVYIENYIHPAGGENNTPLDPCINHLLFRLINRIIEEYAVIDMIKKGGQEKQEK